MSCTIRTSHCTTGSRQAWERACRSRRRGPVAGPPRREGAQDEEVQPRWERTLEPGARGTQLEAGQAEAQVQVPMPGPIWAARDDKRGRMQCLVRTPDAALRIVRWKFGRVGRAGMTGSRCGRESRFVHRLDITAIRLPRVLRLWVGLTPTQASIGTARTPLAITTISWTLELVYLEPPVRVLA